MIRHAFLLMFFSLSFFYNLACSDPLTLVCDIWPPYQIQGQEQIVGFSADLVRAVAKEAAIPIHIIHAYPWKRALLMLETGQADGLFSANYAENRLAFAKYPPIPLTESPWVIWVRKNTGMEYTSLSDLQGRRVGVVAGYSYTPEFWKVLRSVGLPEEAYSDTLNFRKLAAGRLDMLVAEQHNGHYIVNQEGIDNVLPLPLHPIKVDGLYLIFNRKRIEDSTVADFSKALEDFKRSDAHAALLKRYFHDPPFLP